MPLKPLLSRNGHELPPGCGKFLHDGIEFVHVHAPFHSDLIGCSTLFRLVGLFVVMCCRAARPAVEPAGSGDASSGGGLRPDRAGRPARWWYRFQHFPGKPEPPAVRHGVFLFQVRMKPDTRMADQLPAGLFGAGTLLPEGKPLKPGQRKGAGLLFRNQQLPISLRPLRAVQRPEMVNVLADPRLIRLFSSARGGDVHPVTSSLSVMQG